MAIPPRRLSRESERLGSRRIVGGEENSLVRFDREDLVSRLEMEPIRHVFWQGGGD